LLARPFPVGSAVEEKNVIIARPFELLETQHLRIREAPLLRRGADQLKNFLRFRRPLWHLGIRVVGNKLQMETIRTHGAAIIARSAAPDQREHRDFDRVAGRQRFFMKQRPETVLPATAGKDDEQQYQGEQQVFHARWALNCAIYVQITEHLLPENGFRSTANMHQVGTKHE
jgi:hypothetical protein